MCCSTTVADKSALIIMHCRNFAPLQLCSIVAAAAAAAAADAAAAAAALLLSAAAQLCCNALLAAQTVIDALIANFQHLLTKL